MMLWIVVTDPVCGKVYCLTESFMAQCLPQEMIIVESAVFGRMQIGRCVSKNYGHLGCSVDVLSHLDSACSGLNSCEFSVSDPALVRTRPCPPDFASYLDASYRCVPGISYWSVQSVLWTVERQFRMFLNLIPRDVRGVTLRS